MLGPAPAGLLRADRPRGTVLLLHGLGADALANLKELALLQGAGWSAVGVDAPTHGRRFDATREADWTRDRDGTLRRLVWQSAEELPAIVDGLAAHGLAGPFVLAGISLGACAVWRGLAREPRIAAGVAILGTPEIDGLGPIPADALRGRALRAISAEHDEVIPLAPTRALIERLRARGENAELTIVPGSPHAVPEPQWWRLWGRVLRFLERLPHGGG